MIENLVIVESPAKAKTIEKFLGKDFKVMSSYGHIRDLRKKNFSIDVDNDFQPEYEIPADKRQLVAELKKAASEAHTVWLASDEDREGEAIAWHLAEVLGLDPATTRRIVFHEITKDAILNAIANPRTIDLHRVDAQQARRVLDRIVGFELSPVLWRKIRPSLSAGRVQSVAVRLICEREKEISEFTPEPYFRVTGDFKTAAGAQVKAELNRRLHSIEEARTLLDECQKDTFTVSDINVKPTKKSPAAPFTTSTLQQEAGRKLGFPVGLTMSVAQRLYESGLITYMRTDSLNLSQLALNTIKQEITAEMGDRYVKIRQYHTSSKGAQEAHEAIRPTYIDRRTIDGTPQEKRLYDLIWKRTIASQMADAEIEKTTVDIRPGSDGSHYFQASGEVIKFDGFLKVYLEDSDDDDRQSPVSEDLLPAMTAGETLQAERIHATERFTQQPPRFTEASLVKKMEELGIGRPSTYAPTISTIQHREYIEKGSREGKPRDYRVLELHNGKITEEVRTENWGSDKGKLIPTDTGIIVNEFLTDLFPNVLDYNFTARVEEKFDEIAEGKRKWNDELRDFYSDFHPLVDSALTTRTEHKVGERLLGTDPESGKNVFVKIGRFGPLVQIGDSDSDEKPRFASLLKGQSMSTLTLDEALKLFDFPRNLGDFEDKAVTVAIGRFGPYVRHDGKFVSIPKELEPAAITLDEAVELIKAKREADAKRHIKSFEEDPEIEILNGRYGPYIVRNKTNYKIPKTVTDPAALTYEEVKELIEKQDATPKRTTTHSRAAAGKDTKTTKTASAKTTAKSTAKSKTKKSK